MLLKQLATSLVFCEIFTKKRSELSWGTSEKRLVFSNYMNLHKFLENLFGYDECGFTSVDEIDYFSRF